MHVSLNLTVGADLTVGDDLHVADNITANGDIEAGFGAAGFGKVEGWNFNVKDKIITPRDGDPNAKIYWDETSDRWQADQGTGTFVEILTAGIIDQLLLVQVLMEQMTN